jgi:DHA2 family multidrug resistance protein-like MFS transporter
VGFFVAFGTFLAIAQYLQLVLGMTPLEAGLWTAPYGLAFIAGSMLAPALARRLRPTDVIAGGFAVAGAGFLVLTQIGVSHGPGVVVTAYVILSLGLSPVFTMATDLVVGTAPAERAGMAAGLSETTTELGGALGIAVLGSLITAIYRRLMASVSIDPPAALADTARDSLGGAAAVAATLPGPMGASLLTAAREAFTEAVIASAMVTAALAIAAAVVTATLLRAAGPPASPASS